MALDPHFMEMEWQNGFEATLDARVVLSDTYIPMTPVPEGGFGRLVLEDTSKENFEIIRYNRKDAAGVFVETGDGGLRNEDGSSSGVHPRGARVRGNITAQDIREMRAAAKAAVDEFQSFIATLPDWRPIVTIPTVDSIDGQRQAKIRYSGVDLTSVIPLGSKLRIPRTGVVPTTSFDFERDSSQYAQKVSPTGTWPTDDWSVQAWIQPESFIGSGSATIISRYSPGGGGGGWIFRLREDGRLNIFVENAGNYREFDTTVSIPIDKTWVHVAGSMDASANVGKLYVDGVEYPVIGGQSSTPATSTGIAGNLTLGYFPSGGNYFDGRMADVRVYNSIRTQAQILADMNHFPSSNAGMIAWFKGNGDWNDSSVNANHLTPINSAVNNYADFPFKAVEYAIVTGVTYTGGNTILTLFTGNSQTLPNQTLGATSYSTIETPIGFPSDKTKWRVESIWRTQLSLNAPLSNTWYYDDRHPFFLPVGAWELGYRGLLQVTHAGTGYLGLNSTLSTSKNSVSDPRFTSGCVADNISKVQNGVIANVTRPVAVSAMTPYYLLLLPTVANSAVYWSGNGSANNGYDIVVTAQCAYV